MTTCSHLSGAPGGKKVVLNPDLTVKVRNDGKKNRETIADFTFLLTWLGSSAFGVVEALAKFTRRYASATPIYNVRVVLKFWERYQYQTQSKTFLTLEKGELERHLSALRYAFFRDQTELGKSLATTTVRWKAFLNFVEVLSLCRMLPSIRITSPSLIAPRMNDCVAKRENAVSNVGARGPLSFNHDGDSYNETLFEQLSLTRSDEEYLEEYTSRLRNAIETIKVCALRDFRELVEKQNDGKRLIDEACGDLLDALMDKGSVKHLSDPRTGINLLDPEAGHPKVLANLLYVVYHQMGGLPKVHIKFSGSRNKQAIFRSEYPHWRYVQLYGMSALYPYLGVMTSNAMSICLVLILLEHPNINASSLIRARLEDFDGRQILLAPTGEGKKADISLTVLKPRSGSEKSAELSPLSLEVIEKVLNWTQSIRDALRSRGNFEAAGALWVGINMNTLEPISFSHKTAMNSLKLDKHRLRGEKKNKARTTPFIDRHPELSKWSAKINFKALRVNCGVLKYLETDGDLVATARVFGHKTIETTIGNYIPKPLRLAMHERQIRRHQNKLIVTALDDHDLSLKCSDFKTIEELHVFLKSQSVSEVQMEDGNSVSRSIQEAPLYSDVKDRVIIYDNIDAMAIALLYRKHLMRASDGYVNIPDQITGLTPRFWISLVDALLRPLPLSFSGISSFVCKAQARMEILEQSVNFPDIK